MLACLEEDEQLRAGGGAPSVYDPQRTNGRMDFARRSDSFQPQTPNPPSLSVPFVCVCWLAVRACECVVIDLSRKRRREEEEEEEEETVVTDKKPMARVVFRGEERAGDNNNINKVVGEVLKSDLTYSVSGGLAQHQQLSGCCCCFLRQENRKPTATTDRSTTVQYGIQ